jgi:hypothetical protein
VTVAVEPTENGVMFPDPSDVPAATVPPPWVATHGTLGMPGKKSTAPVNWRQPWNWPAMVAVQLPEVHPHGTVAVES